MSAVSVMARLSPSRKGDHMQMLLSANDMEAVVGSELLNGMETLESKIRKTSMNVIADGKDLLCESALSFTGSQYCGRLTVATLWQPSSVPSTRTGTASSPRVSWPRGSSQWG